ncbi:ABC transporter permease [Lapidilactobacillus wuchangensis]|uniref:ABC transporter permease n=1 Tax=Lapidilactobacillus wuchangensis TaxID=2486001 RepID=UPI000F7848DA|nr:ABC transporter permease subunit [Lapidilactobacillus wuchangensis]
MILILFKKELRETWRTWKLPIMLIVFVIFGIMNPLMAKLTPEILKMSNLAGKLSLPAPTSLDSWTQFYKNISQIGIYLFMMIFAGIVNHEVSQHTLVNLVTKGLSRNAVIWSKWLILLGQWLSLNSLSFLVTWGYTAFYFPDNHSPHPVLAFLPLLILGCFIAGVIVFASTITRSNYQSLLIEIFMMIVLYLINLFKQTVHYNPLSLMSKNLDFLQRQNSVADYWPAMLITVGLGLLLTFLASRIFAHQRL